MRITMPSLQAMFNEHYQTELHNSSDPAAGLIRWEFLRGQIVSPLPDTVYICDKIEVLEKQVETPVGNLIFCAAPDYDREHLFQTWQGCILIVYADQAECVAHEIHDFFSGESRKSALAAALFDVLKEGKGIQALADAAYPFLQNPVVIFNAAYRIVGVTSSALQAQESEVSNILLENGGFSSGDYIFANRNRLHSRVKKSKVPVLAYHEQMRTNQLLVSVNSDTDYGHIAVNEFEHPFSEIDRELLMIFRDYVYIQMKQEAIQSRNANHAFEHFILELLDEKIVLSNSYQAFIQHLDYSLPATMRCLMISTELTPGAINMIQIHNQIDYLFPNSKVVVYDKKIVGIIPVVDNGKIPQATTALFQAFCEKNKLYAAISNSFSNVMELRLYFRQSLRALEAARSIQDVPGFYVYEDYYLVHLQDLFFQKEKLDVFLCPALKRLNSHDAQHHTELAYTLYMYLLNDRNLVQTAKAMNMHRSSLIYRFEKIKELLDEIPESFLERQYYILSYQFFVGNVSHLSSNH